MLADSRFDISDSVALYCFKLDSKDVEKTSRITSVRLYVERVIGVKQKYTMLQSTVPITLLQNNLTVQLTTLVKMVRVACAWVNLSESIKPPD